MDEQVLSRLVEWIEAASPVVWETARRQAYVTAIQELIIGLIALAIGLYALRHLIKAWHDLVAWNAKPYEDRRYNGDDKDVIMNRLFTAVFIGVPAFVAVLMTIMPAIGTFLNPNWYAILKLAELVR